MLKKPGENRQKYRKKIKKFKNREKTIKNIEKPSKISKNCQKRQ